MTVASARAGLARRLRPIYVAAFLQNVALWVPIERLFMTDIGFDNGSVALMAAAHAAVVPLLEVPSGILADRWSRRGVVFLAQSALLVSEWRSRPTGRARTRVAGAIHPRDSFLVVEPSQSVSPQEAAALIPRGEGLMTEVATSRRTATTSLLAARLASFGVAGFVALLAILHVLRSDLDPSWHFISEYAIGRHGWLMVLAFLTLTSSVVALVVALRSHLRTKLGRVGQSLLAVTAIGLMVAAIFTTDPITASEADITTHGRLHNIGGTLGIALPIAAASVTWALLRLPGWAASRRPLICATALALLGFVASFVSLGVMASQTDSEFGPDVKVGWPNRLEIFLYCIWLVTLSRHAVAVARRSMTAEPRPRTRTSAPLSLRQAAETP
jgi:hypothetical protein